MRRMTFSPLASRAVPDYGKRSGRDRTPVSYLIVHHWAGTSGGDARLLNPSEQVSASYILYSSGELVGQVPEEFRPWTSGSWDADAPAITVETQNSANGGEWPVSDKAVEKLAQLAADLCQRYGWGSLDRSRVRGHREFASTACPGPFLWARLDVIVARGNEILNGGAAVDPTKGFDMPALIQHPSKSIGFVSDAGELDVITNDREREALEATICGPYIPLPNPLIWDLLAARTARLRAARASVDPAALAAAVAPLLVGAVVEALEDVVTLTSEDVEAAVEKVTKTILRNAAE